MRKRSREMPTYYFNVRNIPPALDEIGQEFLDDEAAWHEATRFAGELFKDVDGELQPGGECALDVTDENKRPLFEILIATRSLK